jgi:hypothetical protein
MRDLTIEFTSAAQLLLGSFPTHGTYRNHTERAAYTKLALLVGDVVTHIARERKLKYRIKWLRSRRMWVVHVEDALAVRAQRGDSRDTLEHIVQCVRILNEANLDSIANW